MSGAIYLTDQNVMNQLFPIFLKLENLKTLIIGGGNVGLEKISAVVTNSPNAQVTLVSSTIRSEIKQIAFQHPSVRLKEREFLEIDLDNIDLAIVATDDHSENTRIRNLAKARKILVNVADTPAECDFYLSSVVRKGNLKLAISTNGLSPTLAKRLREVLTEALPDNLETAAAQLNQVRELLKGDFQYKVEELNRITEVLLNKKPE